MIRFDRTKLFVIFLTVCLPITAVADRITVSYSRYFNAEGEKRYQPDGSYSKVLKALGESFDVKVDTDKPTAESLARVDVEVTVGDGRLRRPRAWLKPAPLLA